MQALQRRDVRTKMQGELAGDLIDKCLVVDSRAVLNRFARGTGFVGVAVHYLVECMMQNLLELMRYPDIRRTLSGGCK